MVTFAVSSIVGSAQASTWSQAQVVNLSSSLQLMVVVQLHCSAESGLIDLATIGAEILAEFEGCSPETWRESHVRTMVAEMAQGIAEGVELSILVAYTESTTLRLFGRGEVVAYLLRDGKLADLQPEWGAGTETAGQVQKGDVLLLATRTLVTAIGAARIKELLDSEAAAESLAPLVHMQPETSGMAALVGPLVSPQPARSTQAWWHRFLPSETKIVLDRHTAPRKVNLWIGSAIFVLLVIMIGIGMVRRTQVLSERAYTTLEKSVTQKLSETVSIGDLNPERARSLLTASRGEVDAYVATHPRPAYVTKAQQLLTRIATTEDQAFKKNTVQLSTVVELPILAEGLTATKMKGDGKGNLLFLDTANPRIVQMNITDRSRSIVSTESVGQLLDLGVSDTTFYGLDSQGVTSMSVKKPELKRVITPDEFWQEPTLIGMFAGNAYILDRGQGEVWKYPTLGDTFGGRRRWFAAGITLDLSNVIDMKVVGDIWFLTSTGKLERYSRGAPVAFSMDGFPAKGEDKRLSDPVAVYPTESLVYVLERGASRVVVFGDDGNYKSQYVNADFGKASDLVVQDGKGYVLVENAVKTFDL